MYAGLRRISPGLGAPEYLRLQVRSTGTVFYNLKSYGIKRVGGQIWLLYNEEFRGLQGSNSIVNVVKSTLVSIEHRA
jgi:hypothetical protein